MSDYQLLIGDALEQLRTLPSDSVSCCVTSPPYLGLRDYGTATWEGGDAGCDHVQTANLKRDTSGGVGGGRDKGTRGEQPYSTSSVIQYRSVCGKCGARRVDQQIGLESSPDEYVARLVAVFAEVRRVLHPSGTLWLNLGDSYASSGTYDSTASERLHDWSGDGRERNKNERSSRAGKGRAPSSPGLKPKDLIGIPWLVAFALRADGWWLRQEIIWHKTAPMPESVTDRCTKAHEQVFLLAKSERYFFDAEAIKEPSVDVEGSARRYQSAFGGKKSVHLLSSDQVHTRPIGMREFDGTRNKRSVWTLGPESYSGAHYAVMPTKLVEPCVLAGSSAHGVCEKCLAPWERVVERGPQMPRDRDVEEGLPASMNGHGIRQLSGESHARWKAEHPDVDRGWTATCTCGADVVPSVVLDPFCGSGTVLAVALKHGRRAIGIDLDPRNEILVRQRIEQSQPLLFST